MVPQKGGEFRLFERAGAKNVKVLHTRNRAEADDPTFWEPLKEARAVWFSGGRQWRFVDAYEGTATEKAFHEVLKRGGVIGGSSAGTSTARSDAPNGTRSRETVACSRREARSSASFRSRGGIPGVLGSAGTTDSFRRTASFTGTSQWKK